MFNNALFISQNIEVVKVIEVITGSFDASFSTDFDVNYKK